MRNAIHTLIDTRCGPVAGLSRLGRYRAASSDGQNRVETAELFSSDGDRAWGGTKEKRQNVRSGLPRREKSRRWRTELSEESGPGLRMYRADVKDDIRSNKAVEEEFHDVFCVLVPTGLRLARRRAWGKHSPKDTATATRLTPFLHVSVPLAGLWSDIHWDPG